jgi:hypothetical protein
VFESRVLRRIFEPKRDEITGCWRMLHNKKLHNLYFSPSNIRMIASMKMRWARYAAYMGERISAYNVMVGRSEGKRSLGRSMHRWEDTIKMDVQ